MRFVFLIFILYGLVLSSFGQAKTDFPYRVVLEEIEIEGLPGMHSFAFAQHNEKWLIIGGRLDGLHARQPFASFPASHNNTFLLLIDPANRTFKSRSIESLSPSLQEQLQATNMYFTQSGNDLILVGGYAFAASVGNHITFPNLTVVDVSGLMSAIESDAPIQTYFRQLRDEKFAVNGGQLGKIGDTFLLVGGHRFDGRYNPMGGGSFTQTYTEAIISFKLDLSGDAIRYLDYQTTQDAIHLHRRDYNLVPYMFDSQTPGYLLSSGVFQTQVDLPFLYPVEITADGYTPRQDFNQYLSNYHGPKTGIFDSATGQMHALFFGGISQYYYEDDQLVKDDAVPFVKTISRVSRTSSGEYEEFKLDDMPKLNTASAEFIINPDLPQTQHKVILLDQIQGNEFGIGHILGGIDSPLLNPFASNRTQTTNASALIYKVKLVKDVPTSLEKIDGSNPYDVSIFPNPAQSKVNVRFHLPEIVTVHLMISSMDGKVLYSAPLRNMKKDLNDFDIPLDQFGTKPLVMTFVFNNKFSVSKKLLRH